MFCNKCGAQLPDGTKFCTACGTPVAAAPFLPQQPPQSAQFQQGAMDPDRYQQLLAEKARRDAEAAAAAQPRQPYPQDPCQRNPQSSAPQPFPQNSYPGFGQPNPQYAAPPFGQTDSGGQAAAGPYDPAGYGQPYGQYPPAGGAPSPLPVRKKKSPLPFILIGVGVLAAVGVAVGVFWEQITDLFSGGSTERRSRDRDESVATIPDETAAPAEEPTEPVADPDPAIYYDPAYAGTYDVTLWVDPSIVGLTEAQIADFNRNNGAGIVINPTVEGVSPSDAAVEVLSGYSSPDLFCFAQDQTRQLYENNALSFLYDDDLVEGTINPGDAEVVTIDGSIYAYPLATTNGYFLYYDKSVVSPEDAASLENIISDCERTGSYFAFELEGNAWYAASFFFGAGCRSAWSVDSDGAVIGVEDDFCSNDGITALWGMKKLLDSPCFLNSSDASAFTEGAAALVSGAWAYEDVKSILGDDLEVAELPGFTVGSTSCHLGSFSGGFYLGVNNHSSVSDRVLHYLAAYLTSERAQVARYGYTAGRYLPADLDAQQKIISGRTPVDFSADPMQLALMAQNRYAVPQGPIHSDWWMIAKELVSRTREAGTDSALWSALEDYQAALDALFEAPAEEDGWFAIGSFNGTDWDTDFPMYEYEDGLFLTYDEFYLEEGDEFKVRQNHSWDVNYGANGPNGENFVVSSSGYYYIGLDLNEGTIGLYYYIDD